MVKTKQIACEATDNEIEALKKRAGKDDIKGALNDAMQYFITHKEK